MGMNWRANWLLATPFVNSGTCHPWWRLWDGDELESELAAHHALRKLRDVPPLVETLGWG